MRRSRSISTTGPLDELVSEHEQWCRTGGAKGERHGFGGVDFRLVRNMQKRCLTTLEAEGGVFYDLDMAGVELQGAIWSMPTCGGAISKAPTCAGRG